MKQASGDNFGIEAIVCDLLHTFEHQRRALYESRKDNESFKGALRRIASEYLELKKREQEALRIGSKTYWSFVEKEVFDVIIPEYSSLALNECSLEKADYKIWRRGDLFSRIIYGALGTLMVTLFLRAPLPSVLEDPIAIMVFGAAVFAPEAKRFYYKRRYSKVLNRMIEESARQQEIAEKAVMIDSFNQASEIIGQSNEHSQEKESGLNLKKPDAPSDSGVSGMDHGRSKLKA